MQLMQLIGLRRFLPKRWRVRCRWQWDCLLEFEQFHEERKLYRQFINRGELVFDVGAHMGKKTAAFLSLGARVISVYPNPVCAEAIKEKNAKAMAAGALCVECVAVAPAPARST